MDLNFARKTSDKLGYKVDTLKISSIQVCLMLSLLLRMNMAEAARTLSQEAVGKFQDLKWFIWMRGYVVNL